MNGPGPIAATYDYGLVTLSVAIALITAYTAIDMAGRVTANTGKARAAWLTGGACALGCGIWSMHFIGMLAYHLPIPVYYHVPTVALSLLAAVAGSWVALYTVSGERLTPVRVLAASVLMGTGIAAMHYIGMAAMRLQAMHHYDPSIWLLSIALAVVISCVGILLIFRFREEEGLSGWKAAAAICIGLAIPVMHYTGMAAVTFVPMPTAPNLAQSIDISSLAIFGILIMTCVIFGFALLTSMVDRRLAAQHTLLEGERSMLRALIDNIPDFMYVKDTKCRFVVANPKVARWVGAARPEDVIGKTDFDFYPREIAQRFYEEEQKLIESGDPYFNHEETTVDCAGNSIPILSSKVPLRDAKGRVTGLAGVSRDISERKKNENALREAERKFRGIFDEAIVGIFQISPDGRLLSANPALCATFGYATQEEMLAAIPNAWEALVDPAKLQETFASLKKTGRVQHLERDFVRADGVRVCIASSIHSILEKGAVVRYDGMTHDITERKALRAQLLQAQKLESVGQLAAGIAHELNTPIQFVGDNIRFLKDAFADLSQLIAAYEGLRAAAAAGTVTPADLSALDEAVRRADPEYLMDEIPKAFTQSAEGITRVSRIVDGMKEFSHPSSKEKTPSDLNRAIQSTVTVATNEWKYVADLNMDLDPSLPPVSCLLGEFNQVILNLIVNASHAIGDRINPELGERGKIVVRTRNLPECAEIRVEDTGSGIPVHVRERIFDPFFTTKEVGRGTGQGLAIARSVIVDKHEGTIDFETELGKGTTFIIRLPHEGRPLPTAVVYQ